MRIFIGSLICVSCLYTTNLYALGDLLMTVQERAKINVMRSGQTQPVEDTTAPIQDKAVSVKLNGFYFKNKGKGSSSRVWINGNLMTDPELGSDMAVENVNEKDLTVSVIFKKSSSTIPIKVGQKLMLNDGEIRDAYQQ